MFLSTIHHVQIMMYMLFCAAQAWGHSRWWLVLLRMHIQGMVTHSLHHIGFIIIIIIIINEND